MHECLPFGSKGFASRLLERLLPDISLLFQGNTDCFPSARWFFFIVTIFFLKTWKIAFDQFHNQGCRSGGLIFQARSSVHLSVLSEIFVAPERDGAGRMGLGDGWMSFMETEAKV